MLTSLPVRLQPKAPKANNHFAYCQEGIKLPTSLLVYFITTGAAELRQREFGLS